MGGLMHQQTSFTIGNSNHIARLSCMNIQRRDFLKALGLTSGSALLHSCAGFAIDQNLNPSVVISPAMMMQKLSPHFPVSKDYRGLASLQFSNPVCSVVPQANKVRVGLSTLANLLGAPQGYGGDCQLACGLRYDADSRGIYLKDATLEQFNISGVNSQWTNNLRAVANIVGKESLERYPVYTLPSNIGTNLLRSMQVQDNGVRLSFGLI